MSVAKKRKQSEENIEFTLANKQPRKNPVAISTNWQNFLKSATTNVTHTKKDKISKANVKEIKAEVTRPKVTLSKKFRQQQVILPKGMKLVAMDCEMVEISDGTSMLARVSLVDNRCNKLYDTFVKPREEVTDYRTHVSGVREKDFENAKTFEEVQKEVADILKGSILVGHAIRNDLHVLYLSHPKKHIRDTSKYKPFRSLNEGRIPSLKFLAKKILHKDIQEGEHDSIIDAKTTMQIYLKNRYDWEKELRSKVNKNKIVTKQKSDSA